MARIQAYVDDDIHQLLKRYSEENSSSISHAAGKLIASQLTQKDNESQERTKNKQTLARLLNGVNQILMCVYDSEKVSIKSDSAKECLDIIKDFVLKQEQT